MTPNTRATTVSLLRLVKEHLQKGIELLRPCRTACLLALGGLSVRSVPDRLLERVLAEQKPDGGWVGPPDTMWSLVWLRLCGLDGSDAFASGLRWLEGAAVGPGWGRSDRDMPRIPITGRMLLFLPELATSGRLVGLEDLWASERNSLTYKAALTLAPFAARGYEPRRPALVRESVAWLAGQANSDGGFAPWREHPVGSEIYCTATALLGLLAYRSEVDPAVVDGALRWVARTQLPSGLWPYHQIEDGSAWGLYASVHAAREATP